MILSKSIKNITDELNSDFYTTIELDKNGFKGYGTPGIEISLTEGYLECVFCDLDTNDSEICRIDYPDFFPNMPDYIPDYAKKWEGIIDENIVKKALIKLANSINNIAIQIKNIK